MTELGAGPPARIAHHHPAVKWGLMVALLAVVGLSVARPAAASAPSVQAPTGSMSGGSFSGPFSFVTYINCTSGVSYNSSYTSNLDGNNTFTFYGAVDGTLLLSINGGGYQLLNSCGDPYNSPTPVATYTVAKNTVPSPTPMPSVTPAPTPTPVPSSGTSGGTGSTPTGSSSSSSVTTGASSKRTTVSATNTQTAPVATPAPTVSVAPATASPSATPAAVTVAGTSGGGMSSSATSGAARASQRSASTTWTIVLVLMVLAGLVGVGITYRGWLRTELTHLRLTLAWRLEPRWFRLKNVLRRRHGATLTRQRGLSHHRFSGRLMAHHHTSYAALAFLILLTTIGVTSFGLASHAANTTLSLEVAGPAPTVGATITDPADGATLTSSTISVRGECPAGLRVEVSRNGTFAGSTICDNQGLYTLVITLTDGTNALTALDYDGANQPGPGTPAVGVTYTAPPPTPTPTPTPTATPAPVTGTGSTGTSSTPSGSAGITSSSTSATKPATGKTAVAAAPLVIISSRHYYDGVASGTTFELPLSIDGGTAPYHITIDWGDATQTALLLSSATANPTHTYSGAGIYQIAIQITDHLGRRAAMSLVAVVSGGAVAPITTGSSSHDGAAPFAYFYPVLVAMSLIVFSFWLGERDHIHRVRPAYVPVQT